VGFWNRLRHHLFDNPISQRQLGIISRLLRVALAETDTDAGFERLIRQMVQRETGLGTEHAWRFVLMHMEQYRRPAETRAMPRTLAQRFLKDPPIALSERGGFEPPDPKPTDL
jgi:hypothetical protein